jgi:hypothetical protein
MAGALYDKGREAFLGTASQVNWTNDTIKAVLVSASYAPNLNTHQFVAPTIHAHTGTLTAQTLGSKSTTDGVADGSDVTFTAVTTGRTWDYIALFKDSGNPNTSQLIALLDSGSATGLPMTSSGGDIVIAWNNGVNRIFKL